MALKQTEAFWVGAVSSALQMTLIYALAFLYSATVPAYLSTMLSWFLGGAAGCWLPAGLRSRNFFLLAALLHLLNTGLLNQGIVAYSWMLAAFAGGAAGAHWVCRKGTEDLGRALFLESLGMAAGFLLSSLLIYRGGMALIWLTPSLIVPLWWAEER